jgi:hypothetical protein
VIKNKIDWQTLIVIIQSIVVLFVIFHPNAVPKNNKKQVIKPLFFQASLVIRTQDNSFLISFISWINKGIWDGWELSAVTKVFWKIFGKYLKNKGLVI